ncbi:hypothetical protein GOP47_0013875 [Adiantum capillus-veneris]|uniref:Uncharacterized protein n=1 Tax=Adiantum capillus-veneris TaxID=13818 RepID=A0A9D4UPV1_ADICA|nr:hypothetical protein GOP47_0013875 [Adiantum capillus-veneris]
MPGQACTPNTMHECPLWKAQELCIMLNMATVSKASAIDLDSEQAERLQRHFTPRNNSATKVCMSEGVGARGFGACSSGSGCCGGPEC